MTETFTPDQLRRFATCATMAHGVPEADARLLADTLVTAEEWGHHSHGMLRLPWYLARLDTGATAASFTPQFVVDHGAVVVLDGGHALGQVVTQYAVELGVARARTHGISAVGVRNSGHFGTAEYFTRQSAEAGCVAILATNASPAMAPWGGKQKILGTNPWSIAAPAGDHGVAVLDIANTAVARGKIYYAKEEGIDIPVGWAADADGVPTVNAAEAVEGLILPMAGHKGYIISFMMDVLAGVLTGSNFGSHVVGPYQPEDRSGAGHMLITIDVASMLDPAEFDARMGTLIDEVVSAPKAKGTDRIYFPGEIEDVTRAATTRIELPDETVHSLQELAAAAQLPPLSPA